MSQQKQAPLPRQEFQEWLENAAVPVLVLQKGKHLGSVVKVPATPEIDYLFGCETFYGERISWSDRLEFCGLYDRQHQALHLLDDPLPNFVSGLTEEECQDSTAFGKRIAQEVDRYVEAAISNERSRLSVRELTSERNINSYRYYKGTEAGREAASLVFSGEKPDVQFHSEYYTSLTEDTLLSYEGRVLVLSPDTLKESCWTPQNQLWLAHDGFGCSPHAVGRSIRCTCLGDGEQTRWNRTDFTGVLKEEFLPGWAREKLEEFQGQNAGMGGMEMT